MNVLTQLLPLIMYPLGMTISLSLVSCLFLLVGRKKIAGLCIVLAIILLWGASTQVAAEFVMRSLERHYPPLAAQDMPSAEAIVILGGVTRGIVP
ncbi:MAG: YdcF family protein, partial [Candidatus Electrothrix sp. AR3]|nr:YdcF family protein [Candidatus Electrothrix sp. AR3]